jgi:hypothetical protein
MHKPINHVTCQETTPHALSVGAPNTGLGTAQWPKQNLIDFDETMAYDGPQENTNNAQITAEQLKQTLYNLSPQQCTKLANTMGQQEEDFPNV